jgi:hypothetical protein
MLSSVHHINAQMTIYLGFSLLVKMVKKTTLLFAFEGADRVRVTAYDTCTLAKNKAYYNDKRHL